MVNDYYTHSSPLAKGTKARAEAVNAFFDSLVTGLDKLPSQNENNRGTRNFIASDTGSVNAYAGALTHVSGSYKDGQEVDILIGATNTSTSCTLNVSTIGATAIKTAGANNPAIGVMQEDSIARFKYNDTLSHWELMGVYNITSTVSAFVATLLDDATKEAFLITLGFTAVLAELNTLVGNTLKTKVIDIGDWDMNVSVAGDLQVTIAHGLTLSDIRSVSALIRNDGDTVKAPLDLWNNSPATVSGSVSLNATNAICTVFSGGAFDDTDYNDGTSYNRGWITIRYV